MRRPKCPLPCSQPTSVQPLCTLGQLRKPPSRRAQGSDRPDRRQRSVLRRRWTRFHVLQDGGPDHPSDWNGFAPLSNCCCRHGHFRRSHLFCLADAEQAANHNQKQNQTMGDNWNITKKNSALETVKKGIPEDTKIKENAERGQSPVVMGQVPVEASAAVRPPFPRQAGARGSASNNQR